MRADPRGALRARPLLSLFIIMLVALSLALASCTDANQNDQQAETASEDTEVASGQPNGTDDSGTANTEDTAAAASGFEAGSPSLSESPALAVAEQLAPSVVTVFSQGSTLDYFGQSRQQEGSGSGVIYREDGYIVTNNHVVTINDRPVDQILVRLATGEELKAEIVGRDAVVDLAVLKIEAEQDLPAAEFLTDIAELKVGQYAIAIGSPLGVAFDNSVTLGIVSGVGREIPFAVGADRMALTDLIQTDAAISPGNSGGALADAQARVIGINVAYIQPQSGAQDLGFAIPADLVVDVADELIATGDVQHAYLGIQTVSVSDVGAEFNLDVETGALVYQVFPGTPAEQAGLERGDVIVEADGTGIDNDSDLFSLLRRRDPGDEIGFTLIREGEEQTIEVTLGARPEDFGR